MASDKLEELEHELRVIRAWIQKYADWRKSDPHERANYQRRISDLQRREQLLLAKISWHRSVNRIAYLKEKLSSPAIDSAPPASRDLSLRQFVEKLLEEERDRQTALEPKIHQFEMPLWNRVFHEFPKKWMTPESVEMGYLVPWSTTSRKKKGKGKPAHSQVKRPESGSPPVDNAGTEPESVIEAAQPVEPSPSRSKLIDLKIEEVERETGREINRKEFARVTGYSVRSLQLYQQGKATSSVVDAFNRVLNLPAKTIMETLDKKTSH